MNNQSNNQPYLGVAEGALIAIAEILARMNNNNNMSALSVVTVGSEQTPFDLAGITLPEQSD
ncbi:MAG: hypothetical protein K0Q51_499 [Rickettsiaceae bacterium]|jgi:hypothetical protein|nr:hypothetical protein [Rickettsiaceae bacterium]